MKFAQNRMYVESYLKCRNCGILIFHGSVAEKRDAVTVDGARFCSSWCAEWARARTERRAAEVPTEHP